MHFCLTPAFIGTDRLTCSVRMWCISATFELEDRLQKAIHWENFIEDLNLESYTSNFRTDIGVVYCKALFIAKHMTVGPVMKDSRATSYWVTPRLLLLLLHITSNHLSHFLLHIHRDIGAIFKRREGGVNVENWPKITRCPFPLFCGQSGGHTGLGLKCQQQL